MKSISRTKALCPQRGKDALADRSKNRMSGGFKTILSGCSKMMLSGFSNTILSGCSKTILSGFSNTILSGCSKTIHSDYSKVFMPGKLKVSCLVLLFCTCLTLVSCRIEWYSFSGASIDYNTTKTIQIDNFPIRSAYVWAPMQSIFQNKLTDIFASQTKLKQVKRDGNIVLSGEITGFDQYNKGIASDGYSSQVQLKMTVNVRYVRYSFTEGKKEQSESWEKQFSATTEYDASQQLVSVQEELVTQMVKDITDQIFNATVANW